jgi:hypothetical protein
MSLPVRLAATTVSVALLFATPARAALGEGDITPESATSARLAVDEQGKQLVDSGAFAEAAELYWTEGVRLKDPILIVQSAETLREQAAAERSIEVARSATERIKPALDMLYFLRDGSTAAAWQPIAPEQVSTAISRAETLITDAEALIAEIEEEQRKAAEAALVAAEEPEKKGGPAKPGTVLIAAGAASAVVGLGFAGMGIAGLALGAKAQGEVEDPLVYEPEHSAAEDRGKTANILAGVGLAVAGVGVGVGVALIVLGIKKRKQAGDSGPVEAALVPVWLGQGGGLGVVGRF